MVQQARLKQPGWSQGRSLQPDAAPKGIGEDRSFSLFAGATYIFSRKAQVGLLGGLELGGKVRLEDKNGNQIIEENHDPAGFIGISFNLRFLEKTGYGK